MKQFMRLQFALVLLVLFGLASLSQAQSTYDTYVNDIQPPVQILPVTQDVQAELEAKVTEMVNLGHLAPTMYFIGLGGAPAIFYATPSETIYTLSAAYPYLSAALQAKVKTYLDSEIASYPPLDGYYPPNAGKVSDWKGERREYFVPNLNQSFNFWPSRDNFKNVSLVYSIWLYSNNTNNWSYATSNYDSLKSLYTAAKSDGKVTSYPELAGIIGFARIAKQLNKTSDYNDALTFARTGFTAAKDFNAFLATAKQNFPNGISPAHGYTTPPFLFQRNVKDTSILSVIATHFNRDIGRFLKDNAKSATTTYVEEVARNIKPWWVSGAGMTHGENSYITPEIAWTAFMIHAYAMGESAQQLKSYLDAPDRKGDLLYIQKLVAVIEQGPNSPTAATPTATNTPKATTPGQATNTPTPGQATNTPTTPGQATNTPGPTATFNPNAKRIYLPFIFKSTSTTNPTSTPTKSSTNPTATPNPLTPTATPNPLTPTASATGPAIPPAKRRVNVPNTTTIGQMAIFWFGQVDNTNNHVQVRVGYDNTYLKVRVTAFDRYVWYNTNPTANDLENWDSVALYLDLNGDGSNTLDTTSYRFVAQMENGGKNPNPANYQAAYQGSAGNWQATSASFLSWPMWQGGDFNATSNGPNKNSSSPDASDERGWRIVYNIPFTSVGLSGPPKNGSYWKMAVVVNDRDNAAGSPAISDKVWPENIVTTQPSSWGQMVFNPSAYQPFTASNLQSITIRQGVDGVTNVMDADVGGSSMCGDNISGGYKTDWSKWGNFNSKGGTVLVVQNQDNVADWPCYSKAYLTFPLDKVPTGKAIVSATLTLYHMGGSTLDDAAHPAYPSMIQLFDIAEAWNESTITWNNAPLAKENILASSIQVEPIRFPPEPNAWSKLTPRVWNVTQLAEQAHAAGNPLRLALYETDENINSGKYFVSSDTQDWNANNRPILKLSWGDAQATATPSVATPTASASTPTATATSAPATSTPTATPTKLVATSTPTTTIPTLTATATKTPIVTVTLTATATKTVTATATKTPVVTVTLTATATKTVTATATMTTTPTVTPTATATPSGVQFDPNKIGEKDPDNPANPWYANGKLTLSPYPVKQGQATTMNVVVNNPTTVTQVITLQYYVSGLGVGQWWTKVATKTGVVLTAGTTITDSFTWYPAADGHYCSQVIVSSATSSKTIQRNIDVLDVPTGGGCPTKKIEVCNAFATTQNFSVTVTQQSPLTNTTPGTITVLPANLTLAAKACEKVDVSICAPVTPCGEYTYRVEAPPGQDGILFTVNSCPKPTVPTSTVISVVVGEVAIAANGKCSLREALINATNDAATHADCQKGVGVDTIDLAYGTYDLTDVFDSTGGKNGLPPITSAITINGNKSTIKRNSSSDFRIFYVASNGNLTLNQATIANGKVATDTAINGTNGGGILNLGVTKLANVTLDNNSALLGGGINNKNAQLTIVNSTLSNNIATAGGGGLYNDESGSVVTITNSTLSGNSATNNGGGIKNANSASLTLLNSTLTNNIAQNGGGIKNDATTPASTVNLKNTIVAGNSASAAGPDIHGLVIADAHNLVGNSNSSGGLLGSDMVGITVTEVLSPTLANNGGDTKTHALVANSKAIDAADNNGCPTTDQRGETRPTDGDGSGSNVCDVGAVEASTILNHRPTDITMTTTNIPEYKPISTTVGLLSTTDADSGNTFVYSLVAGSGDANNGSFFIEGTALKTKEVFTYALKKSYSVMIQTDDGRGGLYAKQFTINIISTQPDLAITKQVMPTGALTTNQVITYTITFSNIGQATATGVKITDTVPSSLTNLSVTSSGVVLTATAGYTYTWQIANLNVNDKGVITITGKATSNAGLTNTAVITNSNGDSDSSNNQATVTN